MTSSKTGKEMIKRTMQLSDDSGKGVELTLWGSSAENFPEDNAQVVAFKGLRVTEWNQRSLSLSSGGSYEINPELEATERLKSWWTDGGAGTVQSLTVDTRGAPQGGFETGRRRSGSGPGDARQLWRVPSVYDLHQLSVTCAICL